MHAAADYICTTARLQPFFFISHASKREWREKEQTMGIEKIKIHISLDFSFRFVLPTIFRLFIWLMRDELSLHFWFAIIFSCLKTSIVKCVDIHYTYKYTETFHHFPLAAFRPHSHSAATCRRSPNRIHSTRWAIINSIWYFLINSIYYFRKD